MQHCLSTLLHHITQVRVRTGDVRGAGTDADVSIILKGSKAHSEEIQLESSADNFERNKVRCAFLHTT